MSLFKIPKLYLFGVLTVIGSNVFWCPQEAKSQGVSFGTEIRVLGHFLAPETDPEKPKGISGIGCLQPMQSGKRSCFVVNDEERIVELAAFADNALTPTAISIKLVSKDKEKSDLIWGVRPTPGCNKEEGKYREVDGEGITVVGNYIYVTGSHSCAGNGKFKPSSYLLIRFKVDANGKPLDDTVAAIERTWRLSEALQAQPPVKDYFGKPKGEGTNIEGLAVVNDRLYAGLRTPSIDGIAYIVSASVTDLFEPSAGPLKSKAHVIHLALGKNTGIRDLAALNNGRLLLLAGPAREESDVDYSLLLLEAPDDVSRLTKLVKIETPIKGKDKNGKEERAKAEAIVVVEETDDRLRVLVLYDNIDDGGPHIHDVPLK